MHLIQPHLHTRRAFLRRAGQLAFTGAALPTAINLAALGEAAAFNAGSDYKALVCIFLYGGNDYANTVVPYDAASYAAYQTIRGTTGSVAANGIALAQADLAPMLLNPTVAGAPVSAIGQTGLQYALHPSMTGLRDLFNTGRAAVLLNTGPLVKPITKAQYQSNDRTNFPVPPKLFSHNDQQSIWQSSSPEGSTVGWGGNLGDLAMSSNATPLFTCISVTGNAVFLSGDQALSYQVGTGGAVRINSVGAAGNNFGLNSVGLAMQNLTTSIGRSHILENEYNRVTRRAVDAELAITSALSQPDSLPTAAAFSGFDNNNPLSVQLRMVARLISARTNLNNKRQVFMVSLGGFDSHDNLLSDHIRNMGRVSSAMKAFYDCMSTLGVANKVTAFTATDFGRTLSSNGDGSDHGWGSHQIIMGDAVNGQAFYGYAPPVSVSSTTAPQDQWHVGQGRLLPTTSVDQYAATLAKWFGVDSNELTGTSSVLPFLDNFAGRQLTVNGTSLTYANDLGFMKPA
ncbi:DUF1501 domain-containing protein [Variovorax sp. PCZ-1]|uniref:DUF1501 domain-containing protein n=1 Tax=Variovorax sp. PCZ-1 TaxID=2835533 RepID=UPI001BD16A68|nr:DUF1501 domain-containing protein [Variovorax sp. PCZ-1]MBS7809020.1 DUF1501 domain-containing protein [Variovorax sp. PCZ-1]